MSDKFFFKGRKTPRPKYESFGYNTKRHVKLGTIESPLLLTVNSATRQQEVEQLVTEHGLVAQIELNPNSDENIIDLLGILNRPKAVMADKKTNRNDLCPCDSGKKFKKCCGN